MGPLAHVVLTDVLGQVVHPALLQTHLTVGLRRLGKIETLSHLPVDPHHTAVVDAHQPLVDERLDLRRDIRGIIELPVVRQPRVRQPLGRVDGAVEATPAVEPGIAVDLETAVRIPVQRRAVLELRRVPAVGGQLGDLRRPIGVHLRVQAVSGIGDRRAVELPHGGVTVLHRHDAVGVTADVHRVGTAALDRPAAVLAPVHRRALGGAGELTALVDREVTVGVVHLQALRRGLDRRLTVGDGDVAVAVLGHGLATIVRDLDGPVGDRRVGAVGPVGPVVPTGPVPPGLVGQLLGRLVSSLGTRLVVPGRVMPGRGVLG